MKLKFKREHPDATLPTRGSEFSAGLDLYAIEDYVILPGERKLFRTGWSVAVPSDRYMRIAPRSGLAFKHGIDVLAGVIDSDYRGEIGVILLNTSPPASGKAMQINKGDRIAQAIIEVIESPDPEEVDVLPDSARSSGGFGSTGK